MVKAHHSHLACASTVLAALVLGCGSEPQKESTTARPQAKQSERGVATLAAELAPLCVERVTNGQQGEPGTPEIAGLVDELVAAYEAGPKDNAATRRMRITLENLSDGCGPDQAGKVRAALSEGSRAEPAPESESAPAASSASIEDGTWEVGQDVRAGTYRAEGGGSCYWAILKGPPSGDNIDNIKENDVASSNVVVTLKKGQYFETRDCGEWTRSSGKSTANATEISDGTWEVGADVSPGTYRAKGGDACYWAILKGPPSGDNIDNIKENDVGSSNTIVTLSKGQYFQTRDCGDWSKR